MKTRVKEWKMSWREEAKKRAAAKAVDLVKSGMVLGIGSGTTTAEAIKIIGRKLEEEQLWDIKGVPTSYHSIQEAVKAKIPLTTLDEYPQLDLGIDGADQIDPYLNAIKGHGGAMLREKIVASSCRRYILIADESKLTDKLGKNQEVYLEVHPFAITPVLKKIIEMGAKATVRQAAHKLGPVITDNGNNLIDALFGPIENPHELNRRLHSVQGLMETGFFLGYADIAYIGTKKDVKQLKRS
jgi:ribose 5-phosphate isomerase A